MLDMFSRSSDFFFFGLPPIAYKYVSLALMLTCDERDTHMVVCNHW